MTIRKVVKSVSMMMMITIMMDMVGNGDEYHDHDDNDKIMEPCYQ